MAIFDTTQRLSCIHCGNTTFTESNTYMYDKGTDNKVKRVELTGIKLRTCAKCGKICYDERRFFEGATIIE